MISSASLWNLCTGVTAYLLILTLLISGTNALQCFNCRGNTVNDFNQCFEPELGNTIVQECPVGAMCEKKLSKVGRAESVIERGCSTNCNGRRFIWTDDFIVHCCDDNFCNHAWSASRSYSVGLLTIAACAAILFKWLL